MKRILILLIAIGFATAADAQNVLVGKAIPGSQKVDVNHVTASGTAATLVVARGTRTSCLIRNTDSTISIYIGPATVSSSNGMLLKAGESVVVTGQNLWQVIAASGAPVVDYIDEYN